ncbi:MAG: hypothetical protein ABFD92_18965 [Planctomycetaceae bacterium]|nr:hypothetical protein [Planctomycetaceae bacterium]
MLRVFIRCVSVAIGICVAGLAQERLPMVADPPERLCGIHMARNQSPRAVAHYAPFYPLGETRATIVEPTLRWKESAIKCLGVQYTLKDGIVRQARLEVGPFDDEKNQRLLSDLCSYILDKAKRSPCESGSNYAGLLRFPGWDDDVHYYYVPLVELPNDEVDAVRPPARVKKLVLWTPQVDENKKPTTKPTTSPAMKDGGSIGNIPFSSGSTFIDASQLGEVYLPEEVLLNVPNAILVFGERRLPVTQLLHKLSREGNQTTIRIVSGPDIDEKALVECYEYLRSHGKIVKETRDDGKKECRVHLAGMEVPAHCQLHIRKDSAATAPAPSKEQAPSWLLVTYPAD